MIRQCAYGMQLTVHPSLFTSTRNMQILCGMSPGPQMESISLRVVVITQSMCGMPRQETLCRCIKSTPMNCEESCGHPTEHLSLLVAWTRLHKYGTHLVERPYLSIS